MWQKNPRAQFARKGVLSYQKATGIFDNPHIFGYSAIQSFCSLLSLHNSSTLFFLPKARNENFCAGDFELFPGIPEDGHLQR